MRILICLLVLSGTTSLFGQAILEAVAQKDYDKVSELIKKKGIVNKQGKNGVTPAQKAATVNDLKILQLLVENGADTNLAGDAGWTPLMIACQDGYFERADFDSGDSIHVVSTAKTLKD
jgi:ankyrin repeat protein